MVRTFRIGIIAYLRDNNGADGQIDIKTHFLPDLDTLEKRKAFKQALDTLSNEKLIVLNGSYDFLNWKLVNSLYPIGDKIIEAKITAKGLTYQEPTEVEIKPEEPEPRLDIPLPPAVKAISDIFISKTKTEDRLVAKMKKLGATDEHLDIKKRGNAQREKTKHVPAVHNPLADAVDLSEFDSLSRIQLQKGNEESAVRDINVYLKWAVIIVCAILVTLIVMVLKDTA